MFWDTMLFAYWLENNPEFGPRVQEIYTTMRERGDLLCSSAFVLGELLVGPLKVGDLPGAKVLEVFMLSGAVTMLPFPATGARLFAELRAKQGIRSVDALHLATAAAAGVDLFLTNDHKLRKLHVPGIQFIATLQTDLF